MSQHTHLWGGRVSRDQGRETDEVTAAHPCPPLPLILGLTVKYKRSERSHQCNHRTPSYPHPHPRSFVVTWSQTPCHSLPSRVVPELTRKMSTLAYEQEAPGTRPRWIRRLIKGKPCRNCGQACCFVTVLSPVVARLPPLPHNSRI